MLKTLTLKNIPRNVWILGLVSLFTDTASKIIQSLLPLFLVSVLGVNLITVGTIEGIAESTASILKVFSGALSDYWKKRKQLAIAGYGLSALIVPIFALANSPLWVLIGRFGDRVGKGIRVAPRNALVADVTSLEQRGAAYGLRQSLDTIGAAIGPLIAVALMSVSRQNFRLVFWLATIPGIFAVLLLIFGIKEKTLSHRFTALKRRCLPVTAFSRRSKRSSKSSHEFFNESYEEVQGHVHDIGERQNGLGGIPAASFTKLAELCCFEQEEDGVFGERQMVEHDLVAEQAIIKLLRQQAAQAESLGDRATRYLYEQILLKTEERAYHLQHFLVHDSLTLAFVGNSANGSN